MSKRIWGLILVAFLVLTAQFARAQQARSQTVYTYVSEFQVPRANWVQFAEDSDKTVKPIFERLMADGTILSWGIFEDIVHTPQGTTHGAWWQATSLAGITHVLDELRKAGPRPGQLAATKHEDLLLRSVSRASAVAGASGYLRVIGVVTQPGKSDQYVEAIKKYLGPTFEEQLKNGTITYYGMDAQYVNTEAPSLRYSVFAFPNAQAMDTFAAAITATFDKMSPDERKAWEAAIAETTVPNSRRDFMSRITHYAHK